MSQIKFSIKIVAFILKLLWEFEAIETPGENCNLSKNITASIFLVALLEQTNKNQLIMEIILNHQRFVT